mmetsp:Transcript_14111/g.28791  ORF Transcript_14111/g.28791 Transcript_14111/m.28791 type:complete len:135 (-) Transcript_14111:54-458(-)
MAAALEEEKKAMTARGRAKNIPTCGDFIRTVEDIKSGKVRRKTAKQQHPKKSLDAPADQPPASSSAAQGNEEGHASTSLPKLPDKARKKTKKSKSKSGQQPPVDHPTAAVPPKDPWDFDPSIEILSVEGGEPTE